MSGNKDVIFLSQKITNDVGAIWPGDLQKSKLTGNRAEQLPETSKKRPRSPTEKEDDTFDTPEPKRLNFMQNRYFSCENVEKIKNSESVQPNKSLNNNRRKESKEFTEKRDYLIKRLMQSRNLPNQDESSSVPSTSIIETRDNIENTTKVPQLMNIDISLSKSINSSIDELMLFQINEVNNSNNKNNKSKIPQMMQVQVNLPAAPVEASKSTKRENSFKQEDFIKLSVEEKKDKKEEEEEEVAKSPNQYPKNCIHRARQYLIQSLKPSDKSYTDRVAEIVKIKINLQSRFSNDEKTIKRIKRDTASVRQAIYDRMECLDRKEKQYLNSKKKTHKVFNVSDDSSDSDCQIIDNVKSNHDNRKKEIVEKKIDYLRLDQNGIELDDLVISDSDSDSENESDVIKMINESSAINLDDEESEDCDSKCLQIRASTSSKTSGKSNLPRLSNILLRKMNNSDIDEQLEKWTKKYKNKRSERNQILKKIKKTKGTDENLTREKLTNDLKTIRFNLKKLRKCRNSFKPMSFVSTARSSNSNSLIYFENKKPINKRKRSWRNNGKKIKNPRIF